MCELIRGEGGGGRGVVHLDVEVEENECFVYSLLRSIVYCNIYIYIVLLLQLYVIAIMSIANQKILK